MRILGTFFHTQHTHNTPLSPHHLGIMSCQLGSDCSPGPIQGLEEITQFTDGLPVSGPSAIHTGLPQRGEGRERSLSQPPCSGRVWVGAVCACMNQKHIYKASAYQFNDINNPQSMVNVCVCVCEWNSEGENTLMFIKLSCVCACVMLT